jgi:hypothetical protein
LPIGNAFGNDFSRFSEKYFGKKNILLQIPCFLRKKSPKKKRTSKNHPNFLQLLTT